MNETNTVAEIRSALKDAGITAPRKANKDALLALLDAQVEAQAAVVDEAEAITAGEYDDVPLAAGFEVKPEGEAIVLDLGDGHIVALPKPMAGQLGAALTKAVKPTTATEIDTEAIAAAFAARDLGLTAEGFTAAKAYARAKATDADGQAFTVYGYPSGSLEIVPTGKGVDKQAVCKAFAKKHGGEVKPSGYVRMA